MALVALALFAFGIRHLESATDGLLVEPIAIGTTPATLFRLRDGAPAPAIVIAHGFAGSRQLMQPFAVTLARNGYVAITYDLLGHGKDPAPLRGDILKVEGATRALVDQLAAIVAFARRAPGSDGHVALLGHSMASDIVVRAAEALPGIDATVAVSMFSDLVTPTAPRDLLVVAGALEPSMLKDQGRKATAMATRDPPGERTTYGDLRDGTARRFSFSADVEHVGVLYSRDSLREALNWLNAVYARRGSGFLDARGPALGFLILGIVLLGRPLATLLPRVAPVPRGAGLGWSRLLPVAIAPAVLTPLILWKAPTGFLPILLGDYLAAHFFVYGALTAIGLRLVRGRGPAAAGTAATGTAAGALALGAGLVALYGLLVLSGAIDRYIAAFTPIPARIPFIAAILVGTLPYALADEWLVRGPGARRGAYALTKMLFLASLAGAVALNPQKLFFLAIIVVVIALFFVIYGLFSGWAYRATRHPFVGGLANALTFAWALGVTFPILGS